MADAGDLDYGATVRSLAPGERFFDRFTLVRMLGRGGMGIVWLARDEQLELEIAIKFLPEMVAADESAVADLARETRRARELSHPYIVRVYDFHRDQRLAGVSMEWIDGGTLTGRRLQLPHQVFEPAQLETWVRELTEALDYAHQRARLVHRDLKPANLMIAASDDLKITDFGISASVSESVTRVSRTASSSGSPPYMSPQQMFGERPSPADDIYALGATLYELVTSKPPFFSGNIPLQVQTKIPPPLSVRRHELNVEGAAIPPAWERTISACLAKDPADRPASAGEVRRLLDIPDASAAAAPRRETTTTPDAAVILPSPVLHPPPPVSPAPVESPAKPRIADPGTPPAIHPTAVPPVRQARQGRPLLWAAGLGCVVIAAALAVLRPWRSGSHAFASPEVPPPANANIPPATPAAAPAVATAFTLRIDPADAPNPHVWIGPHSDLRPDHGVVQLADLADGDYEVTVQADGFQPVVTRLTVTATSRTHTVALVPLRGRLEVSTAPGATVTAVDGNGQSGAVQFSSSPPGAHVEIVAQTPMPGSKDLPVIPAGKDVTPCQRRLPPGDFIVFFTLDGYEPAERRLHVAPNARTDASATLVAVAAPPPAREPDDGMVPFQHPQGLIAFRYPNHWMVTPPTTQIGNTFAAGDPMTQAGLQLYEVPGVSDPNMAMNLIAQAIGRFGMQVYVQNSSIQGGGAVFFQGSTLGPNGYFQWVGLFRPVRGGVIGLTVGAPSVNFESSRPLFDRVLRSIAFQ